MELCAGLIKKLNQKEGTERHRLPLRQNGNMWHVPEQLHGIFRQMSGNGFRTWIIVITKALRLIAVHGKVEMAQAGLFGAALPEIAY